MKNTGAAITPATDEQIAELKAIGDSDFHAWEDVAPLIARIEQQRREIESLRQSQGAGSMYAGD